MDLALNGALVGIMLLLTVRFFRKDGTWNPENAKAAFRYFTVLSNVLCSVTALFMCIAPHAAWAWMLKYVGTTAVTVTMLTVLLFLGPSYGYKPLLHGADLFMHLINPLLALISFCVFERRGLAFLPALAGLLPTTLYGILYGWKVLFSPPETAWDDFYGFNRNGKWPISLAAMLTGTFLICMGLMALQNLGAG